MFSIYSVIIMKSIKFVFAVPTKLVGSADLQQTRLATHLAQVKFETSIVCSSQIVFLKRGFIN